MGVIRNAIQDFDPAQNVAAEQKALLAALDALASAKLSQMKSEIHEMLLGAGGGSNLSIPVFAIEAEDGQTHASTSDNLNDSIGDTVKSATDRFMQGGTDNIVNGIISLVSSAVEVFLGSGSAQSDTMEKYYVATDGLALWRVDLRAWYYEVVGSGISSKVQRVSAYYYTRSTVDVDKLKFQTFANEYQSILSASSANLDKSVILKEVADLHSMENTHDCVGPTTLREGKSDILLV